MTAIQPPSATQPPGSGLPPVGTPTSRRKWWQKWPFIAGLVAIIVAGIFVVVLRPGSDKSTNADSSENDVALSANAREALRAGEQILLAVTNHNYQSLDQDFQKAINVSTGNFANEFKKEWDKNVGPVAVANKAITTSTVRSIGVVEPVTDTHAVLLAFLDETVKNSEQEKPRLGQMTIKFVLDKKENKWLISALTNLDSKASIKTGPWKGEQSAVMSAGRDCATKLLTTRASNFDKDFIAKQDCSSGKLREDLGKNAENVRKAVLETHAEAVANTQAVALGETKSGRPQILAAAITTTSVNKQKVNIAYRITLDMKKGNGKWQAITETIVGAPITA